MGSSGGGDIDCRVGTIVWVRRRNGSWWPGKILGPNELSASHLMSPRSGTPVKLLGREDASVDWYNLEKSRRVKAFRCGDFDDCIERAESSLGMPAKKREKYARREDAILHALELEKQMLYNKSGNSGEVEIATNCQEKRRKHVNLPTESIDYFNRKKILPMQIEMSPSQIGINSCHALRGSSYEGSSSESTEDDVSDSSETQSLNSATEEEMAMVSDSAGTLEVEQRSMEKSEGRDDESTSSDGLNETAVNGDASHFHPHSSVSGGGASDELDETAIMGDTSQLDPHGAASGGGEMSKWQLKGKRNTRSLTKRSEDLFDGGASKGSILRKRAAAQSIRFIPKSDDFESGFDEFDLIDNDTKAQAVGFDSRVYPLISKQRSSGGRYVNDWEEMAYDDRPAFKGYRAIGSKRGPFDPIFVGGRLHTGGRMKSMLIDVDLKVQASYQKEHDVPIVSLMSRLNGKAIIGRPIQIDILEDGYSDVILSGNDDLGSESLHDGNTALQPVWRTARRTANRIPRSHLSPTSDGDGTVEKLPFHNGKKPPIKKLNTGSTAQKAGKMKGAGVPRPPMNRKIARKPLKKVSLSSSQKIRTLSSIAVEQRVGSKSKRENGNSYVAGLIKTESGQTTVACIPVKLVFSRLFEGVSRPHSRAAGHGEL